MGRRILSLFDKNILNKLYYNLKYDSAFSSPQILYNKCKSNNLKTCTLANIKQWLEQQNSHTLHKNIYRKFDRRSILVSHIDDTWQIDLVDLKNLSKFNKGYCYLLTCIDVFSKFAWVVAIKNKKSISVVKAFKYILFKSKRKPNKVHSDKGSEFIDKNFQQLLQKNNIKFYTTENSEIKACVVERFHRTLKIKMYKYFTFKNTKNYINVLDKLLNVYNKSFHRSIKMRPIEVNKKNTKLVFLNLYKNKKNISKINKFKLNDRVRISKYKNLFAKGYEQNWTDEEFIITKIDNKQNPLLYHLTDLEGEAVIGSFYEQELQKVNNIIWAIEKIIRSRIKNKKRQVFVKWTGYSDNYNSWINHSDIVKS